MLAILLLGFGAFAAWGTTVIGAMEPIPDFLYPSAEDVAYARRQLPWFYAMATQGIVFGLAALACAVGLASGRAFARHATRWTCTFVIASAIVVTPFAPAHWDMQLIFAAMSAAIWLDTSQMKAPARRVWIRRLSAGFMSAAFALAVWFCFKDESDGSEIMWTMAALGFFVGLTEGGQILMRPEAKTPR